MSKDARLLWILGCLLLLLMGLCGLPIELVFWLLVIMAMMPVLMALLDMANGRSK